jgi:prepilin-type processing-associated H-X9-DG protein
MIPFRCDCGKQLQAREEYAGQVTACPACGKDLTIPSAGAVQAGEPPPAVPPARELREGPPPRRREGWEDQERPYRDGPAGTSSKATIAFVLGLLSFCLPVLLGIPAIILAILGLSEISRSRGRVGGGGLAIAGIVLSCLSMLIVPLGMYFAVQRVREAAARTQDANNLKIIGIALHSYNDAYKKLPAAAVYSQDGRPLYSWRVLILPFIEQNNLFQAFHLNEPWDSPHNMQFVTRMPREYAHPLSPDEQKQGLTRYQVFVAAASEQGPRPPFLNNPLALEPFFPVPGAFATSGGTPRIPASFPDGMSNTILVAEAGKAVPWTSPEDLPYSSRQPLPQLGGLFSGGYNVLLADGSVRFIDSGRMSEQTIRAAITADGGEELGPDW